MPTHAQTNILIAEDNADVRCVVRLVLQQQGYQVFEANNGKSAMEQMAQIRVDVLISDIVMPQMDGIELVIAASACYPNVKIITMSGLSSGAAHRHSMLFEKPEFYLNTSQSMGAHRSLKKPFEPEQLIELVQQLLDQ